MPLYTVWPVISEAVYLLNEVSPMAPMPLLKMLESGNVGLLPLGRDDVRRMRDLMEKYRDLPMDFADAALMRVAEREDLDTVFTTDKKDFRIYRPLHVKHFKLLP